MAALFVLIGMLLVLIGGIWLLVVTFKEGVLWGLGSLVVPVVSIAFVCMHWHESKKPFLLQVAGLVLIVVGVVMAPPGTFSEPFREAMNANSF